MYPAEVLSLFPPFAHTNEVFVAMSFDRRFDPVWQSVFKPAIEALSIDGQALVAHRVDLSRKSDSIITEIVQRVAQCRLVLADVSTTGWIGRWPGRRRAVRNSNVMYELGIAHASRLPEEVVVVRGDADLLDFDIAGVRVHSYPSDWKSARTAIQSLLADALRSVDQRRSIAVKRALQTLDPQMYWILQEFGDIAHPTITTMRDALASLERLGAIQRLLAGGMLQATFGPLPDNFMERPIAELVRYRTTRFGIEVFAAARDAMGFKEALAKWMATDSGKKWLAEQSAAEAPPP
ncbi:MAG: hypothetical protein K8T90_08045 [Planctomycetes bacterium]|nr:hypothetical protein [Planctomycetota bacterium]